MDNTQAGWELTPVQRLADFCIDYDLPKIMLRAYEEVVSFGVDSGQAVIVLRRYSVQETTGQLRYMKSGLVLRYFDSVSDEYGMPAWREAPPLLTWDSDFTPYVVAKFNGRTFAEDREKELWARDCHRPGASRFPMDNFDRTAAYPSMTTEPMTQHWGL